MPDRSRARQALLRRLVDAGAIDSQATGRRLLARSGHRITQTTISRDLSTIGAQKGVGPDGVERYVLVSPGGRGKAKAGSVARMMREFVLSVSHSGNLALLKTPPGAAAPVASALDRTPPRGVLGTVAGDDTVLVVARGATGGAALARRLEKIMEERIR